MNNDSISCQEKTVIFLHIPKTGGLTFTQIASQNYERKFIYEFRGNIEEAIHKFKQLPPRKLKKIKFLTGHFSFGIHEYLPNPAIYITLLREPIERVISSYFYVRSTPTHPLYQKLIETHSFEEFLEIHNWFNNRQVIMLSGETKIANEECSTEMLNKAKSNLEKNFQIFGMTEKFDCFPILCHQYLGWQSIFYQKVNVTNKRLLKEEVSQKALTTIEKKNALDIELYDYAKEKFAQRLRESNLEFDTNLFKLSNQMYQQTYSARELIRRSLQKVKKLANWSGTSN